MRVPAFGKAKYEWLKRFLQLPHGIPSADTFEITAIPELIKMLDIKGCIIAIDAMGCQRSIAETIIDKKADFVFSLKGSQGNLYDAVELFSLSKQDIINSKTTVMASSVL